MADPFDMLAALQPLVETVPALTSRVQGAAELSELIRTGALPDREVSAYLVPLGLRPRGEGDAGTGAFLQSVDESFAVVLVLRTAADVTGGKGLPRLNELVWAVIHAVAGGDAEDAVGVFRLAGGRLHSMKAGLLIYQLDFAIQLQLRIV